jgi:hypothetical protein
MTRFPRHIITENNLSLPDPMYQIFSPPQMAKTSPSALLSPKKYLPCLFGLKTPDPVSSLSFTQWVKDKLAC